VLAIALAAATGTVMSEVLRVVTRVPLEACQWNYMHCEPEGGLDSPALRVLLMALGYLHEFLGYCGSLFTVLGVLVLSWLLRSSGGAALRAYVTSVLLDQRLCVIGYLGYLIILRTSKVDNYLVVTGKAHEQNTIAGMFSHWGSYPNVITHGMSWPLFVGAVWIIVTLASHLLVAHSNVRQRLSDDTHGVWLLLAETAKLAGRPFLWFILEAIVVIVLPPPGWPPLVAVGVVMIGLAGWQRRRA
jgi:hypothetical protein